MSKKQFIIFTLLIGIFISSCSVTGKYRAELLAENLKMEMKNGNFESIYDKASDHVHRNVTKAEFINRLKLITERAKIINPELNWKENNSIAQKGPSGFETLENSNTYYAFRERESRENNIHFLIYWSDESGQPKLFGLSAVSYETGAGNLTDDSSLNDDIAFQMDVITGTKTFY